jgi:hypothetical protein
MYVNYRFSVLDLMDFFVASAQSGKGNRVYPNGTFGNLQGRFSVKNHKFYLRPLARIKAFVGARFARKTATAASRK